MKQIFDIQEYIDPGLGHRVVKVHYSEHDADRTIVLPVSFVMDDLLGYIADFARLYPSEVFDFDGWKKISALVHEHEKST